MSFRIANTLRSSASPALQLLTTGRNQQREHAPPSQQRRGGIRAVEAETAAGGEGPVKAEAEGEKRAAQNSTVVAAVEREISRRIAGMTAGGGGAAGGAAAGGVAAGGAEEEEAGAGGESRRTWGRSRGSGSNILLLTGDNSKCCVLSRLRLLFRCRPGTRVCCAPGQPFHSSLCFFLDGKELPLQRCTHILCLHRM